MKRIVLVLALTMAVSVPEAAFAQAGACVDLCRIPCVKPISIADRWDDVTGIPGYMGEPTRRPEWRNNAQFDQESFTDADGDRLYDLGESFLDGNGNGIFDQEVYDPATTGYTADGDLGVQLVLHPYTEPYPGTYWSVALPPVNKGAPDHTADAYRAAWSDCQPTPVEPGDLLQLLAGGTLGPTNQAMRDLIAADPDATWDSATKQVIGSAHPFSPRIFLVPAYDPRMPITTGSNVLVVRKVLAFFAERMTGSAMVEGRLLRVQAAGETCGGGSAGGFLVECPVPATGASWGRLKAAYR